MILASYAGANQWAGINAGPLQRVRLAVGSSTAPWHQSAWSVHLDTLQFTSLLEEVEQDERGQADCDRQRQQRRPGCGRIQAEVPPPEDRGNLRLSCRTRSASRVDWDQPVVDHPAVLWPDHSSPR